ncbi:MAG: hypothetical protein ACLPKT_10485 [Methylocella sp.]
MSIFGNLFGKKLSPKLTSNVDGFKSTAQFLGAILLWQLISNDRILCTEESLTSAAQQIPPQHRNLVKVWENFYVTWLFRVHVKQKFGDDVSRDMMAAVYGRIATNEDRVPGIEIISDAIKYWFKLLDDALEHEMANPAVINDQRLPFAYPAAMNFIMRDDSSPFSKNATPEFDGFDIAVATALEEVRDASKARIDYTIEKAESLPR